MNNLIMALISSATIIIGALTTYISTSIKQKTKSHNNLIINNKDKISDLEKKLVLLEEQFKEITDKK